MSDSIFADLKASLEEAVEIKNGQLKADKVTRYDVVDVKAIRTSLNATQQDFADVIGSSLDTVKSWESKRRNPTGTAAKLLMAISRQPGLYQDLRHY